METLLQIVLGVVVIIVVLMVYRVLRGPTLFDRLTGLGVIGTNVILILLLLGFLIGRVDMFVDISLAYAMLGFVTFLVLAKYFEGKGDVDR